MISYLSGTLTHIKDSKIVILHGNIGFELLCPSTNNLTINSTVALHTYLHWSQENGPSLYGFEQPVQKDIFLMLIDCQGIGPKLAISILEQTTAEQLISMIAQENMTGLSKIKGLGAKKAEVLCLHLKDKAPKLLAHHPKLTTSTTLGVWNDLHETLASLSYTTSEIRQATSIIKENLGEQTLPFDLLLRKALVVLAKK